MVKQTQIVFGFENGQYHLIHGGLRHLTVFHQPSKIAGVGLAGHVHIHASRDRLIGCVLRVFGETVRFQVPDCKGVREHNALKAPLAAQNVGEQPMIPAGRHVVQIHVSAHKAASACLLCRMEGNQINVAHQLFRHIRGVVVPPTVSGAVAGKMLDADQDAVRSELGTLKSIDLRSSHGSAQVRILAGAFHNAAPPRVARNIHHRCKCPLDARRARILCSPVLGLFFDRGIPRRGHRQRDRKHGAVSMDYIEPKQNGNV